MVTVSGETAALNFVSLQAELFYTAQKKPVPLYAQLMRTSKYPEEIYGGELFSFAREDLDAISEGRTFCPRDYEIGSARLAAYETAQHFA